MRSSRPTLSATSPNGSAAYDRRAPGFGWEHDGHSPLKSTGAFNGTSSADAALRRGRRAGRQERHPKGSARRTGLAAQLWLAASNGPAAGVHDRRERWHAQTTASCGPMRKHHPPRPPTVRRQRKGATGSGPRSPAPNRRGHADRCDGPRPLRSLCSGMVSATARPTHRPTARPARPGRDRAPARERPVTVGRGRKTGAELGAPRLSRFGEATRSATGAGPPEGTAATRTAVAGPRARTRLGPPLSRSRGLAHGTRPNANTVLARSARAAGNRASPEGSTAGLQTGLGLARSWSEAALSRSFGPASRLHSRERRAPARRARRMARGVSASRRFVG